MSPEELYIARLVFSNKLLRSEGSTFQTLFWAVMTAKYGQQFVQVRPQGRLGDGGNDGYLPDEGHYFQVYGPSDPTAKITDAAKKLQDDFDKVKQTWDQLSTMRAYSFAFNDKYQGTFLEITQALAGLEQTNPDIKCRPFTAAHLEDVFAGLSLSSVNAIIGMLPDPARVARVDYSVLNEVITHIMTSPASDAPTRFGDLPQLTEKINLNNLCGLWGELISGGARRSGHIDKFFEKNSGFVKQALRHHVVGRYKAAVASAATLTAVPQGLQLQDLIFASFRDSLRPPGATVASDAAVDIVIGYYFEACDVFDPHAQHESSDAVA